MQSVSAMTINYNSRQPESLCTRVHSAPREEGCEALPLELTSNLKRLKRLVFKKRLYPEISKDPKTLFSLSNRRAVNIARVQNWHSLLHGVNGERSLFERKCQKSKRAGSDSSVRFAGKKNLQKSSNDVCFMKRQSGSYKKVHLYFDFFVPLLQQHSKVISRSQ